MELPFQPSSVWCLYCQGDKAAALQEICGPRDFWTGVWCSAGQDDFLCRAGGTDL